MNSKEKSFINLIKVYAKGANKYIGDDCAIFEKEGFLVSTDSLIEDVHFSSKTEPYYLGWKAAAVNISDIASMGGIPQYYLLSASLPRRCNEKWIQEFIRGTNECCDLYDVQLVGGDLTKGDKIYLCGTILGKTFKSRVAKRSFASPKQKVVVSGKFGNSAAGLWSIENMKTDRYPEQFEAHIKPIPRVKEGQNLLSKNKNKIAMMDASDGLFDCLEQISQQSRVKIKINFDAIPISSKLLVCAKEARVNYEDWVLAGGEDYELVATTYEPYDTLHWYEIGEVYEGEGVEIKKDGVILNVDALKSFEHFC
ncbi:MAG: thiamine-phosphate kinase [Candidatus Caenarcaniphilales bacterium]|nr:thiamine-phosphate kinase [Candidatus Caenarcaniphilales bacterium]